MVLYELQKFRVCTKAFRVCTKVKYGFFCWPHFLARDLNLSLGDYSRKE